MNAAPQPAWLYQVDEDRKRKHHWTEDRAGFIEVNGEIVGKCPVSIAVSEAQHLLNAQSVPYFNPRAPGPNPDRLYVVHRGVVYRAVPTVAGKSFHAFPELPARLRALPKAVRTQIVSLADQLGCKGEVEEWIAG